MQAAMEAGITNPKGQRILTNFGVTSRSYMFGCPGHRREMPCQRIPGLPAIRQNLVNSCLSPGKSLQQTFAPLAAGALLNSFPQMGAKPNWSLPQQRLYNMGAAIQQRSKEGVSPQGHGDGSPTGQIAGCMQGLMYP
jgi:hypothetical protein